MAELKYEIVEHIGVIGENARGWNKELNLISWNEREPKYDIRDWAPDHSKMGKGVTHSRQVRFFREIAQQTGIKTCTTYKTQKTSCDFRQNVL